MRNIMRLISVLLVLLILSANLVVLASPLTDVQKNKMEELLGVYDGYYTATQGLTGLTLSVYRTQDLLNDTELLSHYADTANSYYSSYGDSSNKYSADFVKDIVSRHPDEYIAIFNFFPMVDENGNLPNPNVEEGLYTMTISYSEELGTYHFTGHEWIQHLSYVFVDLENVTLSDDSLSGQVFGSIYAGAPKTNVGNVLVSKNRGFDGYRIVLDANELSVNADSEAEIKAFVKDARGNTATNNVNIKWGSKDEDIVKVTGENWGDSGYEYAKASISAEAVGTTEIYAELDNKRIAICTVTVTGGAVAPVVPEGPVTDTPAEEDKDGSILPIIIILLLLLLLLAALLSMVKKCKAKKLKKANPSDLNHSIFYDSSSSNSGSDQSFKW